MRVTERCTTLRLPSGGELSLRIQGAGGLRPDEVDLFERMMSMVTSMVDKTDEAPAPAWQGRRT